MIVIILILSILTACTRDPEAVSKSGSMQLELEPMISEGIKSSQINSIESTASSQDSKPKELMHPYEWNLYSSWTPNGKYFVCISNDGLDLYNTDNQLEKHIPLPENLSLDGGICVGNEGFYLFPDSPPFEERNDKPGSFWKAGDEILISGFTYIDWDGNILIQRPSAEFRTDEKGNKKYYLDNKEVEPIFVIMYYKLLDEDLILFTFNSISNPQTKLYFVHYIPSQNKFIHFGWHDTNDWSIKTPCGIVWKEFPNLYLTTEESTIQLFQGIEIQHFFVSDEIIVVSQKDYHTEGGYLTPLYYAFWEDLEFKEIGGTYTDPHSLGYSHDLMREAFSQPDYQLMIEGPYIIYNHYQDGLIVYDIKTDESFKIKENWASIEDIRIKSGEWEVILYGSKNNTDPDSNSKPSANPEKGYFVVTKDKTIYYPKDYEAHKYKINPQRTHYIYLSEDHSTFSIRPCIPILGEDE